MAKSFEKKTIFDIDNYMDYNPDELYSTLSILEVYNEYDKYDKNILIKEFNNIREVVNSNTLDGENIYNTLITILNISGYLDNPKYIDVIFKYITIYDIIVIYDIIYNALPVFINIKKWNIALYILKDLGEDTSILAWYDDFVNGNYIYKLPKKWDKFNKDEFEELILYNFDNIDNILPILLYATPDIDFIRFNFSFSRILNILDIELLFNGVETRSDELLKCFLTNNTINFVYDNGEFYINGENCGTNTTLYVAEKMLNNNIEVEENIKLAVIIYNKWSNSSLGSKNIYFKYDHNILDIYEHKKTFKETYELFLENYK